MSEEVIFNLCRVERPDCPKNGPGDTTRQKLPFLTSFTAKQTLLRIDSMRERDLWKWICKTSPKKGSIESIEKITPKFKPSLGISDLQEKLSVFQNWLRKIGVREPEMIIDELISQEQAQITANQIVKATTNEYARCSEFQSHIRAIIVF